MRDRKPLSPNASHPRLTGDRSPKPPMSYQAPPPPCEVSEAQTPHTTPGPKCSIPGAVTNKSAASVLQSGNIVGGWKHPAACNEPVTKQRNKQETSWAQRNCHAKNLLHLGTSETSCKAGCRITSKMLCCSRSSWIITFVVNAAML